MKKVTKNKMTDLIIQIISVMIGVYLGFLISNFGDQRKTQSQLTIFKNNIKTEISNNRGKIEGLIAYHRMLRDSSRYYLHVGKAIAGSPDFLKGLRLPSLINSAYNTGIQTGIINELSINEVQDLNEVYSSQAAYNEYGLLALSHFFTIYFNGDNTNKILKYLSLTMTDLVFKEEELLKRYSEINQVPEKR